MGTTPSRRSPTSLNVVYIFIHLFFHWLHWGVGFRQYSDWLLMMTRLKGQLDEEKILSMAKDLDILYPMQLFAQAAIRYLRVSPEIFPFPLLREDDPHTEQIIRDVMHSGNFGFAQRPIKAQNKWVTNWRKFRFKMRRSRRLYAITPTHASRIIWGVCLWAPHAHDPSAEMIDLVRFILRGHKWGILLILLFGLGTVSTNLIFIWLSKCVIDIAAHQRGGSIHTYSVALILTLALQVLCRVITVRLSNYTAARMSNAVQSKVFAHLLYTRWSHLGQMHSGDMVVRMLKDTDSLVALFVTSLPSALIALAQLVGALCLLYYFSPPLALILGVGMPLLAVFSKVYYKRMRRYTDEMKQSESEITAHIQESLLNQTVIRTSSTKPPPSIIWRCAKGSTSGR